jgi:hypothetical protein
MKVGTVRRRRIAISSTLLLLLGGILYYGWGTEGRPEPSQFSTVALDCQRGFHADYEAMTCIRNP